MIFLKFPDEQTFLDAIKQTNFGYFTPVLDEDSNPTYDEENKQVFTDEFNIIKASSEYFLDIIGDIYSSFGEYEFNESGEAIEIFPPVKIDGYHVNMIGAVPEAFEPYVIERPTTPNRVIFGY